MQKEKEPTNREILEAINSFSSDNDNRLKNIENNVSGLKTDVNSLKTDVNSLKTDVNSLKTDVGVLKTSMVTKEYLDDKMADLRGDLVVLLRKEDTKLQKLVDVLVKRNVITKTEVKEILIMEPFPQPSL